MEEVTDTVFRQIIAKCGKPDVFFTEFTNVEGMCSRGREKVGKRLIFTSSERPIVAQLWGLDPKKFSETAKLIKKMKFDGIDINMGCPEKSVVKRGSCVALINNPVLAEEIISAVRKGAPGLPVSVKTRIGVEEIQTEKWASFLLKQNLDCLIIHGRTAKEMSDYPVHWDEIGKVVKLRNSMKSKTLIIGNGDVKTRTEALEKCKQYGLDGIMVGRGIFENLWVFNKKTDQSKIPYQEKLKLLIKHVTLFDETWGKGKNFSIMKKFYRIYISGMPNSKNVRMELMKLKTAKETLKLLKSLRA
jgi:tRNA-dihydrouridine synthase